MKILAKVFVCLDIIIGCNEAKILAVFPTPATSHHNVFQRVTQELARRGHDLVVVTTIPAFPKGDGPDNLKEIYIDLNPDLRKENATKIAGRDCVYARLSQALKLTRIFIENTLEHHEFRQLIKDRINFDLLLLEGWISHLRVFTHVFKVRSVITITTLGSPNDEHHVIGSAVHPLFYPSSVQPRLQSHTAFEQFSVFLGGVHYIRYHSEIEAREHAYLKEQYNDIPSLDELNNNVDMTFISIHPIWEQNRPVPQSLIYASALHLKPAQKLPEDIKKYLDSSVNGVIYVSFGTSAKTSMFSLDGIQTMVTVLSSLPYDVLWKWDDSELPGRAENIKIFKWLPQADLLRHPKIKLFITQCGLQSTDEALAAGVPLLGIPILGDQWYNAENYVKQNIGIKLEMASLTEMDFRNAVETVIRNDSYRHNVQRHGAILRDAPQSALERVVWWTEYALRHGATHLHAPARNMHWTEYLELELLLIVVISVFLTVLLIMSLIYYTVRYIGYIWSKLIGQ